VNVRVEPAGHHQPTAEVDALSLSSVPSEIRGAP
jgi:hypothetical protein